MNNNTNASNDNKNARINENVKLLAGTTGSSLLSPTIKSTTTSTTTTQSQLKVDNQHEQKAS